MKANHKKRRILLTVFIVLFGIVVLSITLCLHLFEIRDIRVVGNRTVTIDEIKELSGVQIGDNYLLLNKDKLRKKLEKSRYIEYESAALDYSGTLKIKIRERHGMGIVTRAGNNYILDENGMVLEEIGGEVSESIQCPYITGLNMGDSTVIQTGEIIGVKDREQLMALKEVLLKLEETNMMARTVTVHIGNLDNIYIMTTEGAQIVIGKAEDVRLKLLVGREILHQLQETGNLTGASIDISNGYEAHYIPAVLPTITPTPTSTPTIAPSESPKKK